MKFDVETEPMNSAEIAAPAKAAERWPVWPPVPAQGMAARQKGGADAA